MGVSLCSGATTTVPGHFLTTTFFLRRNRLRPHTRGTRGARGGHGTLGSRIFDEEGVCIFRKSKYAARRTVHDGLGLTHEPSRPAAVSSCAWVVGALRRVDRSLRQDSRGECATGVEGPPARVWVDQGGSPEYRIAPKTDRYAMSHNRFRLNEGMPLVNADFEEVPLERCPACQMSIRDR